MTLDSSTGQELMVIMILTQLTWVVRYRFIAGCPGGVRIIEIDLGGILSAACNRQDYSNYSTPQDA
jgi:hypothetical protein